ncbi:hypothetical protein [Aurantiacibacter sediminis]|uniref:Uncharacterized protein n=1 Tax=Aurantiacibacter sediminis TaxID=2793064 RepID=A0ABS0N1V5_9SPHN|nr:hypothetical protein [Aurantiacibacter sediminis]MBH5321236.1 hypothetical protein [Aurantiacibacter sediminis]
MLKNALAIAAATLMAITPIAAQANTRANSAGISLETIQIAAITDEDDDDDEGFIYILLGALLIGGGLLVLVAADTNEGSNASPGTGG